MKTVERQRCDDIAASDMKRSQLIRVVFPVAEAMGSTMVVYVLNAVPFIIVQMMDASQEFCAFLMLAMLMTGMAGSFVFSMITEKMSRANAKYWPRVIFGGVIPCALLLLLFRWGRGGSISAWISVPCLLAFSFLAPSSIVAKTSVYPPSSYKRETRHVVAVWTKTVRVAGFIANWYLFAPMLERLGGRTDPAQAYLKLGLIAAGLGMAANTAYGLTIKGSYVERRTTEREEAAIAVNHRRLPVKMSIKLVLFNHMYVSLFIFNAVHKAAIFLAIITSGTLFRYCFGNESLGPVYLLVFCHGALMIGQIFSKPWIRLFKETQRALMAATLLILILHLARNFSFTPDRVWLFFLMTALLCFCLGVMEPVIPTLFTAASDYAAWKTGRRMDSLSMSIYPASVLTGYLIPFLAVQLFFMNAGFSSVNDVTAGYLTQPLMFVRSAFVDFMGGVLRDRIVLIYQVLPVLCDVAAFLCLRFWIHSDDGRMDQISQDLLEGKTCHSPGAFNDRFWAKNG